MAHEITAPAPMDVDEQDRLCGAPGCVRGRGHDGQHLGPSWPRPLLFQHLRTTNDSNGNTRRILAFYDTHGTVVAYVDEGYGGSGSNRVFAEASDLYGTLAAYLPSIEITPSQYDTLIIPSVRTCTTCGKPLDANHSLTD